MNNTWLAIIVIIAIAIVVWYILHKKTVPVAAPLVSNTMVSAPGVSPQSGQVQNNAMPPPPQGVVRSVGNTLVTSALSPIPSPGLLQHIPIVGGTAAAVARAPVNLAFAGVDESKKILSAVPIAGKPAAAIVGGAESVAKSVTHFFGF